MNKLDYVDGAIIGGFGLSLATMCYLFATGQAIPDALQTIFWALAVGLGLKKTPA